LKAVPARIVRRNDLAALRFAVAVAAPHRRDERQTLDARAAREAIPDRRQDELRLPVRAVEAEARDRVADLRVRETLRDFLAIALEIDLRRRGNDGHDLALGQRLEEGRDLLILHRLV